MNRVFATLTLAAGLLTAGWFAPAVMAASGPAAGEMRVDDQASVFTPEGVQKAKDAFQNTSFKSPAHLTMVTFAKVADDRRAEYDRVKGNPADRNRFFGDWARAEAKARNATGPFVLVSMEGGQVRAVSDRESDVSRGFGDRALGTLEDKLKVGFVAATKAADPAESKRLRDEALLDAANYVASQLKDTTVGHDTGGAEPAAGGRRAAGGGMGLTGWICMGLCVLLGVWVVIGLIRAMSGGGGYGGYGGPGGGGFFTSLMGGMFGAMAGMWMYNNLFGGGMTDASATDATSGDVGDTGAGDYEGGGDGGGSDFGGDTGGGGDFGGGDFGGGDFGGGGGDFGGGDW